MYQIKSPLIADAEKRADTAKLNHKVGGSQKEFNSAKAEEDREKQNAAAEADAGQTAPGGKSALIADAEKRADAAKSPRG